MQTYQLTCFLLTLTALTLFIPRKIFGTSKTGLRRQLKLVTSFYYVILFKYVQIKKYQ